MKSRSSSASPVSLYLYLYFLSRDEDRVSALSTIGVCTSGDAGGAMVVERWTRARLINHSVI